MANRLTKKRLQDAMNAIWDQQRLTPTVHIVPEALHQELTTCCACGARVPHWREKHWHYRDGVRVCSRCRRLSDGKFMAKLFAHRQRRASLQGVAP